MVKRTWQHIGTHSDWRLAEPSPALVDANLARPERQGTLNRNRAVRPYANSGSLLNVTRMQEFMNEPILRAGV